VLDGTGSVTKEDFVCGRFIPSTVLSGPEADMSEDHQAAATDMFAIERWRDPDVRKFNQVTE